MTGRGREKAVSSSLLLKPHGIDHAQLQGPIRRQIGAAKTEVQTTTATKGQQLIDLKEAYDQGVITEAEYEQQKKVLAE